MAGPTVGATGRVPVVAVIGTGVMGAPMARRLARAGFQVLAWNRTADKADALVGERIRACGTVAESVRGSDFVLTMLADGAAVERSVREGLDDFGDAIWIQASTIGLEWTERLIELAAKRNVAFVDAPVLGTKQPAEEGQLVVLASGTLTRDSAASRYSPPSGREPSGSGAPARGHG